MFNVQCSILNAQCSIFNEKCSMTKGSLTYKKEVLLKWWNSLDKDWKLAFNINLFLQSSLTLPEIEDDFKGMMIPEVFIYHFGNEKLEELKSLEPNIDEIRKIVSLKMFLASNCNLKDLSPLKFLKNLKILELESNPVDNAEALKILTDLEDLTLVVNGKKPNQLAIANLVNMLDLTFDPQNQEELEILSNMPSLRTFYTELDFEPDLRVFKNFKNLHKIVGYSPSLSTESNITLLELKNSGVEISWNTLSETI